MKQTNSFAVLSYLIRHYSIPVTKTSIESELEQHPYRENLFAISDVLNNWKIPNAAFRLDAGALQKIPLPCLAHLNRPYGEFTVIHQVHDNQIEISNGRSGKKWLSRDDFKEVFSGNVLVLQKADDSGEEQYDKKRKAEIYKKTRYTLVGLAVLSIIVIAIINHGSFLNTLSWQSIVLVLLKTAGLFTCILLLIHSIDANNPLIQRLCTGKQKDCNAILSSKGAKLTSFLSWSEMGFFYFSGTWLLLLFNNNLSATLNWIAILNLPCLVYSVYSIYYQWRVVRHWCTFCLITQGLFWLEFFALAYNWSSFNLASPVITPDVFLSLVLPIVVWYFIRPLLKEQQRTQPIEQQLRNFKYNESLFQKALHSQDRIELPPTENTIILGSPEAENIVTIVSNPFCQPCNEAHKIFRKWTNEKNSFKVQILFVNPHKGGIQKLHLITHFHQLYSENKELAELALHDWYAGKYRDVDAIRRNYPVSNEFDFTQVLKEQNDWCERARVEGTPAIFLNGYKLPEPWHYQDIKYFL